MPELVVCVYENPQNGFKCFKASKETTAFAAQSGYVMPQIRICSLNVVRIAFVISVSIVIA